MAGMERPITDPFLKRSAAALIVVSNAFLSFMLFEHGGAIEGLLYDSRLLVANGMSPIVAMKLQRAWSSITRWTLQHPYLRTLYSVMLANGLYGDTVLMQVPWLLSSFFETSAQLVLILASVWIMLLHLEPMTVPHVLSIMTQLLLIQLYSGMWTLVALWTFQSSIEEMIEVIAASRGPTIVLSYDPNTQRMTAREMSPPRMGRWAQPTALEPGRPRPVFRPAGRAASALGEDEDLESQDDSSDFSVSQTGSLPKAAPTDKRSSEGITRGPQIERDSILSDEESTGGKENVGEIAGPSAGRGREVPSGVDKLHNEDVDLTPSAAQAEGADARSGSWSGCSHPDAACRRGPNDASASGAVGGSAIGESAASAVGPDQTHGARPDFQGCNVPDAACQEKQTAPTDTGPGFTKIVMEGDKYVSKQFIPSRPPELTDTSERAGTSTAADAIRSESQESTCDPKDGVTVCPGSGQPTRPQGWVCPPGSQCRVKETEIRTVEPKTDRQEGKHREIIKDEHPLKEQLIVIDVGTDVVPSVQQRIAEEATEAIPIHFTDEPHVVPLDDEFVTAGNAIPINLADVPPEEEAIDDLFSNSPTEGGEDRLRGGAQPLEDHPCLSNMTCRVFTEGQCPMHAAMQEFFKADCDVDAGIESSLSADNPLEDHPCLSNVTCRVFTEGQCPMHAAMQEFFKAESGLDAGMESSADKLFFREGDEKRALACDASGSFPRERLCRLKELDLSFQTEEGEEDKLSIDTTRTCSPGGFCRPNEQDISVDIRANDMNVREVCVGDTLSNSATYYVPDVSSLPSDGEFHRASPCKLNDYDACSFTELSEDKDHSSDGIETFIADAEHSTLVSDNTCTSQSQNFNDHKELELSQICPPDNIVDCIAPRDKLSESRTYSPLKGNIPTPNMKSSNGSLCEGESCCAMFITVNSKEVSDEEIMLHQKGTAHTTEDNFQPSPPKEPSVLEEHVSFDDLSLNKGDTQAAIGIKYAVDTTCNAYNAPDMPIHPGDCKSPLNSIYKNEEETSVVEDLSVISKFEMNERSVINPTEQQILKEKVSLACKKNWMYPPENMTQMDDVEAFKDFCPNVGDTYFSFPDDPGFVATSYSPAPHCPEKWEDVVETTNSEGVPTSDQPDVDEESVEMFFDVVETSDGYPPSFP